MSDTVSGILYLVSTPIGNLGDMTIRGVEVLKNADLIAAEDTRRAMILLKHFDIHVPLTSYHMHNERQRTDSLLKEVQNGKNVALLTDAGTPAIADPGFYIARAANEQNVPFTVIPGASALTFAAAAAGLPVDNFIFAGFLPPKAGKRTRLLEKYRDCEMTTFIFESPFKVKKLLNEISECCGPETQIALIREATKIYEEFIYGSASELIEHDFNCKGEFVVAIDMATATKKDQANIGASAQPKRERRKNKYPQDNAQEDNS